MKTEETEDFKFKKETGYLDEIKLSKKLVNLAHKKGFPISDSKKLKYVLDGDELHNTHMSLRLWLQYEHGHRLILVPDYIEKKYYGYIYYSNFINKLDGSNLEAIDTPDNEIVFICKNHEEVSNEGIEYLLNLIPHNETIFNKSV